jgi:hypothetical protein
MAEVCLLSQTRLDGFKSSDLIILGKCAAHTNRLYAVNTNVTDCFGREAVFDKCRRLCHKLNCFHAMQGVQLLRHDDVTHIAMEMNGHNVCFMVPETDGVSVRRESDRRDQGAEVMVLSKSLPTVGQFKEAVSCRRSASATCTLKFSQLTRLPFCDKRSTEPSDSVKAVLER